MEIESQFLVQMEYAEELANTIGQTIGMLPCLGALNRWLNFLNAELLIVSLCLQMLQKCQMR